MSESTEIREIERRRSIEKIAREKDQSGKTRQKKIFRSMIIRTPSRNTAEVPILILLSRTVNGKMKTKEVLEKLKRGPWFERLDEHDLLAVYEKSRKNVFDSIAKFSRKVLVLKKQLYPIGPECEMGIWRITKTGIERARREEAEWMPTYTTHEALVADYETIEPQQFSVSNGRVRQ